MIHRYINTYVDMCCNNVKCSFYCTLVWQHGNYFYTCYDGCCSPFLLSINWISFITSCVKSDLLEITITHWHCGGDTKWAVFAQHSSTCEFPSQKPWPALQTLTHGSSGHYHESVARWWRHFVSSSRVFVPTLDIRWWTSETADGWGGTLWEVNYQRQSCNDNMRRCLKWWNV